MKIKKSNVKAGVAVIDYKIWLRPGNFPSGALQ